MAESLTIARPYAEAVFQTALEEKKLDEWQDMLYALSLTCSDEFVLTELKHATSPHVASDMILKLLDGVLSDEGANLVRVISENGRYEAIPEIHAEFMRLRDKHDRIIVAELTSARPVPADAVKALQKKIADKYNCKVRLNTSIDEKIIGGAVLKIGDEVIDASVKASLQNLSTTLQK